jgi:low affinity Fe/Cu permease
VIKRAEHCDAIPTKPDELLRADGAAQNNLTTLDDKEPEEIERHRKFARAGS